MITTQTDILIKALHENMELLEEEYELHTQNREVEEKASEIQELSEVDKRKDKECARGDKALGDD